MLTTIIIIIFIIIVFFIYKVIKKRNSPVSRINQTYTLFEILSPFDSAPKEIYKHLSPENKGAFWSLISSIMVTSLTCWLGFSLQYFIYNTSNEESSKIAHFQVVDKLRPQYIELYSDTSTMEVFETIHKAMGYHNNGKNISIEEYRKIINNQELSEEHINTAEAQIFSFMFNPKNWENIHSTAKNCFKISSDIAPYLNHKDREKLKNNNDMLLLGIQFFDAIQDSVVLDSISFTEKYIDENIQNAIAGNININGSLDKIYSTLYLIYTQFIELREYETTIESIGIESSSSKILMVSEIINFSLIPLLENIQIIQNQIYFKDENPNPIIVATIFLFIFIFFGYMISRVFIMNFFDRNSLTPNPKMSQDDLNKLNRENELLKRFNCQNKINNRNLLNQLQITEKKLEKECDLNKKNEKRINELILELEKFKERPIKDEETDNKEL